MNAEYKYSIKVLVFHIVFVSVLIFIGLNLAISSRNNNLWIFLAFNTLALIGLCLGILAELTEITTKVQINAEHIQYKNFEGIRTILWTDIKEVTHYQSIWYITSSNTSYRINISNFNFKDMREINNTIDQFLINMELLKKRYFIYKIYKKPA